jgi:putative nucleotidyltransferase with HDIG domain
MDETTGERPSVGERLKIAWHAARLWLIFALGLVGTIVAISLPQSQRISTFVLEPGDPAPQDILAPYALDYTSEVLTDTARQAAADEIPDIYDLPDSSVARLQITNLWETIDYIDTVRADQYATLEQRVADLAAIDELHLDDTTSQEIINLTDQRWDTTKLETASVLEQVMRKEIREGQVEEARRSIPTLVSISLPENQATLVIHLATAFIAPNTFLNQSATETAREEARQSIEPVRKSYAAGETIVYRGEVISKLEIEGLQSFGLLEPPDAWQEIAIRALLVIILSSTIALYAYQLHLDKIKNVRLALTLSVIFIVVSAALQFMIPDRTVLPYIFPSATFPILLTILFSPGMGVMSALIIGALAGFMAPRGLEIGLYVMLSGTIAALVIGRADRLSSFFWAGLASAITASMVIVIFRFPDPATDLLGKATLVGASIVMGLLSASLGFGLLLLIGNFVGMITSLQLIELSRPDHPLLQLMLHNAPGSYQHSLQVANLAEQAARAIGARPLLTRVGALYHDVGKTIRPQFFIENQISGQNVHEQLDPVTSVSVIVSHVKDGLDLARRYRIPASIQAFIQEHHGSLTATYQYHAAIEASGGDKSLIDRRNFTYSGPIPNSRETAILMLADGVEAKARADMPKDEDEIEKVVRWVLEDRLAKGQLSQTELTLKDLDTIRATFINTLKNIYHPRLQYPESSHEDTMTAHTDESSIETVSGNQ